MSVAVRSLAKLISLSSHIALNPVLTASLLWVLSKGPVAIRERLFNNVAALRDPRSAARILKILKTLLAVGLVSTVNQRLNTIALNRGRVTSDKKRWNFSQEIAVVTGGCSGIGALVVKGLVKHGVTVAVLDIQQLPPNLQGYANIKFFACDITDPKAVYSTADNIRASIGSPSILINNAGILQIHTILDTSDEWIRKIFDVNLLSNFTTVKAFLPDMISKNKGHIITVASAASFGGVAAMADYCSTKAGVLSFHESLNQELKNRYNAPNILTTSIHPNWVQTPLIEPIQATLEASRSPIIQPHNVADAIVNQVLKASGGQVFLPEAAKLSTLLRGWPNWMQEHLRGGVSKIVLKGTP